MSIRPAPPACTAGMQLTKDGRCACPPGQTWDGRACAEEKQACPSGTSGTYPDCKTLVPGGGISTSKSPQACPESKPVGTPPNCCPKGMEFNQGACRCPEGTATKKGTCREIQKVCTGDRPIGSYPNCCPEGTQFRKGACRQIPTLPLTCPADRPVGTPPNCCAEGTHYANGACRPDQNQQQQQQPAPQQQKHQCPADGPSGRRRIAVRRARIMRTAPAV